MVKDEVLEATARLERDHDFTVFMEEVKRRRDAARDSLEHTSDPWQTGRAQGGALFAKGLIELVQGARDALAKQQRRAK